MLAPRSLVDKTAIITGGSRGIGLAIARRLALEGARCVLVGRTAAHLDGALKSLPPKIPRAIGPFSGEALHPGTGKNQPVAHGYVVGDVGHREVWEKLMKELKKGETSILVNAAGIAQNGLMARTDDQGIRDIIQTNLEGTILGCKYVTDRMRKDRTRGCVVNISSLLANQGGRGAAVYAASKAGIISEFSLPTILRRLRCHRLDNCNILFLAKPTRHQMCLY